jgi:tetratricopeptide (TPR) repeat protein
MVQKAIAAYETAIRVEPDMTGPRTNLASLLERIARGRPGPQSAELMKRAESLRQDELPLLARDASLAPENADVQYRYGLALYLSDDYEGALRQLERAVELAPDVDQFQTALRLLKEKLQSQ